MTPMSPFDSPNRPVSLFGTREVTADDIRAALFVTRRPLVKPLFAPDRPTGEPVEFIEAPQVSFLQRVIRFFRA